MGRVDYETETFVDNEGLAPSLTGAPYGDHEGREGLLVAHALRGEGFDASEDGTGRGTPLVPCFGLATGIEPKWAVNVCPTLPQPSASGGGQPHAVAFDLRGREGGAMPEGPHETANIRAASGGSSRSYLAYAIQERAVSENLAAGPQGSGIQEGVAYTLEARNKVQSVASQWAVRRLTPRECERLQGFPDGWTDVPYRGKAAADGPRYKALGNSMAVNCMRWIGHRIKQVHEGQL